MKYLIEVTQSDIDKVDKFKYKINPSKYCPIAIALNRVTKKSWTVTSYKLWFDDKDYSLPLKVVDFIKNYDKGLPVNPFSFELDI